MTISAWSFCRNVKFANKKYVGVTKDARKCQGNESCMQQHLDENFIVKTIIDSWGICL